MPPGGLFEATRQELGGDWCVPLGPERRRGGVPPALGRQETSASSKAQGFPKTSSSPGKGGFGSGSFRTSTQGCGRSGQKREQSRVLFQAFHGAQEDRWFPSCPRPVPVEHLSEESSVQHGHYSSRESFSRSRGLVGLSRPTGCLLSCGHSSAGPEVAPVPLERSSVPIHSSPLRAEPIPLGIHQGGSDHGFIPQTQRNQAVYLPRRLVGFGRQCEGMRPTSSSGHGLLRTVGFPDQSVEIRPDSGSVFQIPRYPVRHGGLYGSSVVQEGGGSQREAAKPQPGYHGSGSSCCLGHREHGSPPFSHSPGSGLQETDTKRIQGQVQSSRRLEATHFSSAVVSSNLSVLAGRPVEGHEYAPSDPRSGPHPVCGRIHGGLGCPYGRAHSQRKLGRSSQEVAYQFSRASGSVPGSSVFGSGVVPRSHPDPVRQHDGGVSPQPSGLDTLGPNLCSSGETPRLGTPERVVPVGQSHSGLSECHGRYPEQGATNHPHRVDDQSVGSGTSVETLGHSGSGSVCDEIQLPASSVCVPGSGRQSVGVQCDGSVLGQSIRLRVSPDQPASRRDRQGQEFSRQDDPDSSKVAQGHLVSTSPGVGSLRPSTSGAGSGEPVPALVTSDPPGGGITGSSRVAFMRRRLRRSGLSKAAIDLALQGIRKSTSKVYDNHWSQWMRWCKLQGVDPGSPSDSDLANHLAFLSKSCSLSAASLRVRRAAISSALAVVGHEDVGQSKVISSIIKAAALQQHRAKVPVPDWDLLVVLSYLMSSTFEPLEKVSLKLLTLKTCFLITLAAGRRASEVCNLSGISGDIAIESGGHISIKFLPEFLAKNQQAGQLAPAIVIPSLAPIVDRDQPEALNCPVRALRIYRKRTKHIRALSQRALFLSHNPNYSKDVRVSSISRWLREVILNSYLWWGAEPSGSEAVIPLRRPRPHETRAWSATLAARSVPVAKVLQAAYWSSEDVFIHHYLRHIARKREDGSWALPAVVAAQTVVSSQSSL